MGVSPPMPHCCRLCRKARENCRPTYGLACACRAYISHRLNRCWKAAGSCGACRTCRHSRTAPIPVKWLAIVGHSERRAYHRESAELVAVKTQRVLEAGLTPIVCVGETLEEREAGLTEQVVGLQLDEVLSSLSVQEAARLIVAYEPVWAIGTGKSATSEQAQAVHAFLRSRLAAKGDAVADVPLLYGGSVKPENAEELFRQPDIDGGLIGGASLKDQDFLAICKAAAATSVAS
jgi:triosephosphate isomerase